MFLTFLEATADAATDAAADPSTLSTLMLFAPLAIFLIMGYFMIMRPDAKRRKNEAKMLEELIVGDEVVTKSGIMGRVVNIKDDSVTVETGSDKCRIKMLRSAISTVKTQISE